MIRPTAAGILLLLTAAPGAADSCSMMLFKDDLPDCVKELNSKIFILQLQVQTAESQNHLYRTIVCNMALKLNKAAPDEDTLGMVEAACAEAKAAHKPKSKPAK